MIAVPAGVRVLIATKPVDFRRGADSLAALAREELQRDPFSGVIIVFRSKRADRLKILTWDGSGLVLYWKLPDFILQLLQLEASILTPLSGRLPPPGRRAGSIDCIAWVAGSTPAVRKDKPDRCRRA